MRPADSLLARAAQLLGWQGRILASETANYELLDALAAGELQGVLVCAAPVKAPAVSPRAALAPEPPASSRCLPHWTCGTSSVGLVAASSREAAPAVANVGPSAAETGEAALPDGEHAAPEPPAGEGAASAAEAHPAQRAMESALQPPERPAPSSGSSHACKLQSSERRLSVHTPPALPPRLAACPAVYLSRSAADGGCSCALTTEEELAAHVSATLLPAGPSLPSLHQLLQLVVAPWLAAHQPGSGLSSGDSTGWLQQQASTSAGSTGHSGSMQSSNGTSLGVSASAAAMTAEMLPAAAELLAATHKFAGQVVAAAKHLHSEVAVRLPAGVDLADIAAAAAREEAVLACEQCVEEWVLLATAALQSEAAAKPEGPGPLAELEFWQARAEAYGGLLEQLSVPAVQAVAEVVQRGSSDAALAASFKAQLAELARLALDARDNARFLATLERHFRALAGGSLAAVADAVQPMLNALRMIWVISRHYGDDVHMSNLLERIAHGLQSRLDAALDISTLFRAPAAESLALVRTCLAIARGWQAHYMAQRDKIEASGHPARWEFSKALLFEKTNHISEVCAELEGMLSAVDDFRQFLGPELKAVTGNTSVIEEVSVMVSAMVEPVECVAFNPFDKAHAPDWRAVRQRFLRDADDIKLATRDLIDTCFRKLRSVDAAVQLLHSFQRIQTQGAMQQQMADKLAAVLEHFVNEIAVMRRMFEEGRENPPLARNMPPVAGSIKWCRGLLVRLRRTWVRLQALNAQLEAMEPGRRAAAAMTDLAREMLKYEKARFAAWCSTVDSAVTAGLQQPLLARQAVQPPDGADSSSTGPAAPDISAAAAPVQKALGGGGGGRGPAAAPTRVVVSFPPALLRLMREAKYLDQLGLAVPPLAVNLALQEGQIKDHFQELSAMLERHAAAAASLRSAERALLCEQLAALQAALDPGLARLNWTSLTIPEFAAAVNKAVDQFGALVAQVQKNTVLIEKTIHHISRARLVPPDTPSPSANTSSSVSASTTAGQASAEPAAGVQQPGQARPSSAAADAAAECTVPSQAESAAPAAAAAADGEHVPAASAAAGAGAAAEGLAASAGSPDVPDLQEFYEDWEQHRQQVVEGLVARYRSVGPLLVKVEELVAGTASGKSPRLAGYYAYWERRLFAAVCSMVVAGLQAFHDRLHACRPAGGSVPEGQDVDAAQAAKTPLFRVALSLLPPEVVVAPSSAEVGRQLGRLLRNVVESAKPFVRWMDGTCLEAPEQFVYGEDAEPFVFSFFSDVSQSPVVIRAMLGAQHEVQRALTGLGKAAERWRAFGALWKADRAAALAKFKACKPAWAAVEERLAQYHQVGEDAWAAGVDQDVHFIRVRCAPLAAAVRAEAQAWVRGIAGMMAEADGPQLEELRQQATSQLAAVQQQPEGEEGVERIHQAIAAAEAAAPRAAASCAELEEHCRARWAYIVPPDEAVMKAELAGIAQVKAAWEAVAAAAASRGREGVHAPGPDRRPSLAASEAGTAASAEESRASRRRGSVMAGASRSSMLQRTASSASTASSSSSKAKGKGGKRGPSRQAQAG